MTSQPIRAMGIPWYERDSYDRILQVMQDAHVLPATFEDWQQLARKVERTGQSSGTIVVRAVINPDEFVAWCRGRRLNVDAEARMTFANEAAYKAAIKTK
ncbi:hypothetical protein LPW26_03400 [Rhodopseudomonas sp. HC1]|uniref:hypothetical protein n=1 Tax=Rhodopseudomonas infernalis TaxID=2897386 RepID=UPI001EE7EDF7|nr:hypothetical protein [Rhodopseudomonas infernalis]MCG6203672.1 hypothetical protein [Rhodopseudomonas infernalis]